ncbi:MAG: hypothetical protein N2578_06555 [Bdellovibrionaceae bacterium]|nr:hypothetical protein [Pseudobdellovibrionaceae bacterium]
MEKFLHFWTTHNVLIIEVLFGVILFLILWLAWRGFSQTKAAEASRESVSANFNAEAIEKTLQKIVEQQLQSSSSSANVANQGSDPSGAGAVAAGDSVSLEQIGKLKAELAEKEKLLAELNAKLSAAGESSAQTATISSEEKAALEGKIKELESRLQEYEIISEDIADLSFYKEENQKLQREIEALKKGGNVAAMASASVSPSPSGRNVSSASQPPAGSGQDPLASVSRPQTNNSPARSNETGGAVVVGDDIMAEFAAAVEQQKSSSATVQADIPKAPEGENLDLMKAFEANMDKKS